MVQQERRGLFATLRGLFGGAAPEPPLPPFVAPHVNTGFPAPPAGPPPTYPLSPLPPTPPPMASAPEATYRRRDGLLTPAEGTFYRALRASVGDRWHIVTKVRLADLVAPLPGREWQAAWNRIAAKHVDFALCDPDTLRPRLIIELDDRSHRRPDRVERDAFVDRVFAEAALPILHHPVSRGYDALALAGQIDAALHAPSAAAPHRCARCGGEMKRRVARRGQRAGATFWGCANYPRCRQIVPIEG